MSKSNDDIATHLEEIADRLEAQGADVYRTAAYRDAAQAIRRNTEPVEALHYRHGREALENLPAVGEAIAGVIAAYLESGTSTTLEGLTSDDPAERELASIPGIGTVLAERIHEELGVESTDELREAARDGRLRNVPGIGADTVDRVLSALRSRRPPGEGNERRETDQPWAPNEHQKGHEHQEAAETAAQVVEEPSVAELLDIDREYRERAEKGELRRIAPRKNNPAGESWLPIMHTRRGERRYTALFSNTARAHDLGMTDDWVVIYEEEPDAGRQWTVITAQHGPHEGERLVRGRDSETSAYHDQHQD